MMVKKKYKLREDLYIYYHGKKLYRIEALKDFDDVKKGDLGGYIEGEHNLSHLYTCWLYDYSMAYDNARVSMDAKLYNEVKAYNNCKIQGNSKIRDYCNIGENARITDNSQLGDYCIVQGNSLVHGNSIIEGDTIIDDWAEITGDAILAVTEDYYICKNYWSSGRYITYTRSNKVWKVGCFYGTGEELIAKAKGESKIKGQEYKRLVKYVEAMYANIEANNITVNRYGKN